MTITSLGERRAFDDLDSRRDTYEAALTIGGCRRDTAMLT